VNNKLHFQAYTGSSLITKVINENRLATLFWGTPYFWYFFAQFFGTVRK